MLFVCNFIGRRMRKGLPHGNTAGVRVWPPDINMRSAREEAEMVIYASVREALAKCRLRPSQVWQHGPANCNKTGILITAGPHRPPSLRRWPLPLAEYQYETVRLDRCWRAAAAQIDILVVNCSLFNPTPSLSAMIVNHFKMRSNTITYNLGGMGCSAGVIAIGLAREQLQVGIPGLAANVQRLLHSAL